MAEPAPRRRSRFGSILVLVLLAAAVVAALVQTRRVDQLSARVEGLTADLATSEARIVAHERHLVDVNNSVAALRAGFAELDEVLAQKPPPRPAR